ncbi:MAG: rhodanese-like domain-containing protein [Verrucomicrobiota bacterium]
MPRLSNLRVWVRPVAVLLLLPVLPALAASLFHPVSVSWSPAKLAPGEVTLEDVLKWENILWVDARSQTSFDAGHVSGAMRLTETEWEAGLPPLLDVWQPDQKIVVYCASISCQSSHKVAKRIRNEVGLPEVYVLKRGWEVLKQGMVSLEGADIP